MPMENWLAVMNLRLPFLLENLLIIGCRWLCSNVIAYLDEWAYWTTSASESSVGRLGIQSSAATYVKAASWNSSWLLYRVQQISRQCSEPVAKVTVDPYSSHVYCSDVSRYRLRLANASLIPLIVSSLAYIPLQTLTHFENGGCLNS